MDYVTSYCRYESRTLAETLGNLSAVARDADIGPAFLDTACGADIELRRELESLPRRESRVEDFLESHSHATTPTDPPLPAQVGPYKISTLLGVGGMGEAYRAHDQQAGSRRRSQDAASRVRLSSGAAGAF